MKFSLLTTALTAAAAVPVSATIWPWVTSERLQNFITQNALMRTLQDLQDIASANGNQRAFGYSGFDQSRDYILRRIRRSKNFRAYTQDFPALFNEVQSISFSANDEDIYVYGLTYSPSTSEEGLTAELVAGPRGGQNGCSVADYEGFDVEGKIVIVQRGTCPTGGTLAGRVRPAAAAGAAAVILYNTVPTNTTAGTLSAPDTDAFVPAGFINLVDGEELIQRLEGGENITARFQQTQIVEERITQNVFAESYLGDPRNTIMIGAHLDSVPAGAGINDDGSGTALIMEIFEALQRTTFRNKIRIAWWGAEEIGLVGSRYYTAQIRGGREESNLLLYLNFDMVSRGYWGVFDGDGSAHGLAGAPGSDTIEKLFVDWFTAQGIEVTPAVFTGGSDYAPFMDNLNKPVGGLHTGTGVEQDDCYHQACDTIDNPNPEQLTTNAKAAAHVIAELLQRGHRMIPRSGISSGAMNATQLARRSESGSWDASVGFDAEFPWTQMEGERHTGTCGHEI